MQWHCRPRLGCVGASAACRHSIRRNHHPWRVAWKRGRSATRHTRHQKCGLPTSWLSWKPADARAKDYCRGMYTASTTRGRRLGAHLAAPGVHRLPFSVLSTNEGDVAAFADAHVAANLLMVLDRIARPPMPENVGREQLLSSCWFCSHPLALICRKTTISR